MATELRADQQARLDELVRRGVYADSQSALDDALRLAEYQSELSNLAQEGSAAIARGDVHDHETVMRRVHQQIAHIAAGQIVTADVR